MNDTETKRGRSEKEPPTPMGRRLRDLRKAKGWSQEKLAEKSGISVKAIQNAERDTHDPSLFSVICIADALGCSLDYLVLGKGNPAKTQ